METPYDFVTVAIFAAIVLIFLQRSVSPPAKADPMWHYLAASIGCALSNYLGNSGFDLAAMAVLVLVAGFIFIVIRPFQPR
ncbi:MAG TPA: hypothetical protein VF662_10715 [Allosphingosinicella sp.]|jgi:divalent metal cation (Fe/Co/Zn/Cd) transporter